MQLNAWNIFTARKEDRKRVAYFRPFIFTLLTIFSLCLVPMKKCKNQKEE